VTSDALREHLQAAVGDAFLLGPELGGGAMSRVFVATETDLDREVALKVLPVEHVTDDVVERFRREILLGARLRHRHILPVYAAGRAADYLYYTMPLVAGESLRARLLRERAVSVDMAVRILREVASALAYAHSQGIVHRDVKPENIFLEETGIDRALLADFGIARLLGATSELTLTGTAIGTPLYMSPEQVDGRDVDGRSDIYSLGLVGWEMLAGRRPWAGETIYAIIYSQRYDHLPSLNRLRSDVPRRVQRAIDRALAKDRDLRWPTIEAFAAALAEPVRPSSTRRSLGAGRRDHPPLPTAALPDVSTEPAVPVFALRRRPWVVRALGAAVLVAALGMATRFLITARRQSPPVMVAQNSPSSAPPAIGDPASESILHDRIPAVAARDTNARAAGTPAAPTKTTTPRHHADSTASVAAGEVPLAADTLIVRASSPRPFSRRSVPVSAGEIALLGARAEEPSQSAAAAERAHADSLNRCQSPAEEDQQACLYALITDRQRELASAYNQLSAALRRSAGPHPGIEDPSSVRALENAQRAWMDARDLRCWRARGSVPPLWAPERARCLDDETGRRIKALQRQLQAVSE
jgi:serine/threonine protein kinase/uncharacterized protein YecT (DUF1311 family)